MTTSWPQAWRAPHPGGAEERRRWDEWWRAHQRESREQWARAAIAKRPVIATGRNEVTGASRAAEYLLTLNRARYERTLVTHPSWEVRVTAALALAPGNPQRAAALLLREFEGRYLFACLNARPTRDAYRNLVSVRVHEHRRAQGSGG